MAIDSAKKRKGVGGIPFIPLGVNQTPNASKDGFWRQTAAWGYGGISVGPVAETGIPKFRGLLTHTGRMLH